MTTARAAYSRVVDNTPKYSTSLRRVQVWAFLHFTLYIQVQVRTPGGTASNPAVEAKMYLYLGSNPRSLYLLTSPQDEKVGRPHRGLVFRCNEANPTQAIVEFLPKREIDISSLVKLTNRVVKGCLGLIAIENGTSIP